MGTLEDAIAFAVETHRGQKDNAGEPYILHPLRVMFRLGWDAPEAAKIAAVLHDVVEDSDGKVTLTDLQRLGYAQQVAEVVELLSRRASDTYEQFIVATFLVPLRVGHAVPELWCTLSNRNQRYGAQWLGFCGVCGAGPPCHSQ